MGTTPLHIVLGASTNPGRASFSAVEMLSAGGYNVVPLGIKKGLVSGHPILHPDSFAQKAGQKIHTITLYLNAANQKIYYDWILSLLPERVIFNPGTENSEFENMLSVHGIRNERACTLVLLSIGAY